MAMQSHSQRSQPGDSTVQEFHFEGHPLHLFHHNGEPAFLASEVAAVLAVKDAAQALRRSVVAEKGIDYDVISTDLLDVPVFNTETKQAKPPTIAILYESGFYMFALRSDKPVAAAFTRWVIREVIPAALRETAPPLPQATPEQALKLMDLERKGSRFAQAQLLALGFRATPSPQPLLGEEGT